MKKPEKEIMYDLRSVGNYINDKEGTSIDFWDYFVKHRDICGNGCYIVIENPGELSKQELIEKEWSEEEVRYSRLIYKYFPDAEYFNVWW
jgi:hypothetical protein